MKAIEYLRIKTTRPARTLPPTKPPVVPAVVYLKTAEGVLEVLDVVREDSYLIAVCRGREEGATVRRCIYDSTDLLEERP